MTNRYWLFLALCLLLPLRVEGHVMQYFAYCDVMRSIDITSPTLRITYDCTITSDTISSPTEFVDIDRNGSCDSYETGLFYQRAAEYLAMDLVCFHQRQMIGLEMTSVEVKAEQHACRIILEGKLIPYVSDWMDELINVVDPAFLIPYPDKPVQPATPVSVRPPLQLVDSAGATHNKLDMATGPSLAIVLRRAKDSSADSLTTAPTSTKPPS